MSGPLLLRLPWPSEGLGGFTSTRVGGVSQGPYASLNLGLNTGDDPAAVVENRASALRAGGLGPERVVYLRQTHGARVEEAVAADAGRGGGAWELGLPDCDAVFTRVPGLALAVGHADCLAVVLADPAAGLLGMAHAGWRGALLGLPRTLAQRLVGEGARPERLRAVLSPCLGPDSLELSQKEHELFAQAFGRVTGFCGPLSQGHFHLDLWACARMQLEQAGLASERIYGQQIDTAKHPDLFFSHRRDQGKTGRMMSVAWLI